MIVSLEAGADAGAVLRALTERGLWIRETERRADGSPAHFVIAAHSAAVSLADLGAIAGVSSVTTGKSGTPLVEKQGPRVEVAGVKIGGGARPAMMCGPCAVESEAQVRSIAERLGALGVAFLRGGAFKPRTSPYSFQGHGREALAWMRKAADAAGMRVVTEALSEADVGAVAEHADLIQVGSRNMHNYALLKAIGKTGRAALLKRGLSATIEEWLQSGEYLLAHGASAVVFCERGVRGFDDATRNILDLGAVALLAHVHAVPVIVDPSHGAGRRDLVLPLGRAALAAGAAGLMIETHPEPAKALSDGPQAIPLGEMDALLRRLASASEASS